MEDDYFMKFYIFVFFIRGTTSCIHLEIRMHNYGNVYVNYTFCACCLDLISNRLKRIFLIHKPQDLQWETEYLLCKFENFMGKSSLICPHLRSSFNTIAHLWSSPLNALSIIIWQKLCIIAKDAYISYWRYYLWITPLEYERNRICLIICYVAWHLMFMLI